MKGSVCWSVKSRQVSHYQMDATCRLLTSALPQHGREEGLQEGPLAEDLLLPLSGGEGKRTYLYRGLDESWKVISRAPRW